MGSRVLTILIIVGLLMTGVILLIDRVVVDEDKEGTKQLDAAEIREYEGQKLSSIDDFRENSIKGPQYIDLEDYTLTVSGLVQEPVGYSFQEILDGYQDYKKVVTLKCVEGWDATIVWEGVLVSDIIDRSGVNPDATVVIFRAHDGCSTSLPLSYIQENDILIAYKMNDVWLPPERGAPFQLVAESKWGYKWIKWITEIELSNNEDYRGYWERRGYSNSADDDKGFWKD
ncbi:MAG: molybdopterin-dependent oxidoreductase [Chloroflexota bacterium]|nr:molybdopterin-dependent oxidoreductase [Chloroflexota bacterium]